MTADFITASDLLGESESFTDEQRKARETLVGLLVGLDMVLPRDWMRADDGWGVDADAAGRLATGIYNRLVESGPADARYRDWDTWQMASSFADVITSGGDALIWALIRIGIEETSDEDLAELCESRGFMVRLPRRTEHPCPGRGTK